MMLPLKFAELHNPLFLAGTNLQMKLDPTKRTGLKLTYDRAEKELLVEWAGETAIVPASNVASMTPMKFAETPVKKIEEPPRRLPDDGLAAQQRVGHKPDPRLSAQVDTPQSHVHAGPGHGQTGQEKPKGKVVL